MNVVQWGVLCFVVFVVFTASIPFYRLLRRLYFPDRADFVTALRSSPIPDTWSVVNGEYWINLHIWMKLGAYLVSCMAIVFAQVYLLVMIVGF